MHIKCGILIRKVSVLPTSFFRRKAHAWGYKQGVGPEQWHTLFPMCKERNQSPIDIVTKDVVYDKKLENFNLEELEKTKDVSMELCTNHGRSALVNLKGQNIKVTGGGLPGSYIIEQFHFHWGPENNVGSEHTINGKQFSAELHIVMHMDKFKNSAEAIDKPNGLAVLGYLMDIGEHNKNYEKLTDGLESINRQDDIIRLPSLQLSSLLPTSQHFYRYTGSMTTPPCAPLIWTLFKDFVYLSEKQMEAFRRLGNSDMDLIFNYRVPQPLDGRVVASNFQ